MQAVIPNQVYHFTSAACAIKILEEQRFNPSKVTSCNDPFELDHAPAFVDLSNPKMLQYYSNQMAELITNRNEAVARTMVSMELMHANVSLSERVNFLRRAIIKSLENGLYTLDDLYSSFLVNQRNRAHIYCFSACDVRSSVALWSHYADRHKGVAIAFHFNEKEYNQKIYPVRYSPKSIRAAVLSAKEAIQLWTSYQDTNVQETFYRKMVLTKHADWGYEKEWRVINFSNGNDPHMTIRFDLIPAVYLGLNISQENKDRVVQVVKSAYPNCKIYSAQKSKIKMALEFK